MLCEGCGHPAEREVRIYPGGPDRYFEFKGHAGCNPMLAKSLSAFCEKCGPPDRPWLMITAECIQDSAFPAEQLINDEWQYVRTSLPSA